MDLGGDVFGFGADGDFLFRVGGVWLRQQAAANLFGGNGGAKNCRNL